jgi:hypothetical protein
MIGSVVYVFRMRVAIITIGFHGYILPFRESLAGIIRKNKYTHWSEVPSLYSCMRATAFPGWAMEGHAHPKYDILVAETVDNSLVCSVN